MIAPVCDVCKYELNVPGALLFGPPNGHHHSRKRHICVECYSVLLSIMERVKKETKKRREHEAVG